MPSPINIKVGNSSPHTDQRVKEKIVASLFDSADTLNKLLKFDLKHPGFWDVK